MTIVEEIWQEIISESEKKISLEPESKNLFQEKVKSFTNLEEALAAKLSNDLATKEFPASDLKNKFAKVFSVSQNLDNVVEDLKAVNERDPASNGFVFTLLFSKGFAALQAHRVANFYMNLEEEVFAFFIQSRSSTIYGVDIHPRAKIGQGVMLDHATGIVIGETSVVENDVSIFQGVTLGGTGKETGDRHPKVREGVLISSGAKILGNVEIGKGAKVAAGSVVLSNVDSNTTVAGVPALVVGKPTSEKPATDVDHTIEEA